MTFPEWMEQQRKERNMAFDSMSAAAPQRAEYDFETASREWAAARLEANECAARAKQANVASEEARERESQCWNALVKAAGRDAPQTIGGSGKHPSPR